jgi:hypothetical protein
MKKAVGVGVGLLSSLAFAESRDVPFWPNNVPEAIHAHVDGVTALETVRQLGQFHRVHGSPGFAAAAEFLRAKLAAAGFSDALVEHFPADGTTTYAHFKSYLGWTPESASLQEVSPTPRLVSRFPDEPVALADYSQDTSATAELVAVGAGTSPKDYEGKEVRGRIVLASGPLPLVMRRACLERGALGFLSDFPNQTSAWSGDDKDLVRWGHLSPYETKNTFAFMLSHRQADLYRTRLAAGEKIVLKAAVKARMVPASYDIVSATIPGSSKEEILLTAHLCHQSAGANDNASGSAAIFEVARALRSAVADGSLPTPRRTIRFLWLPEIAGSEAYLVRHPEVVRAAKGGIHMDMVGGLLGTIHGTFHLSRTAESHPHVVNEIAQSFFDAVVDKSARYAEHGGDPYQGLVFLPGSREVFVGDVRKLELGSDHEVYEESSFGIPMAYFHDWPDVTIHTNKDLPENLDATKLGRVSFLGAGIAWTLAALPDSEALSLVALARAAGEEAIARARLRESLPLAGRDEALGTREAVREAIETLDSVKALLPVAASEVDRARDGFLKELPRVPEAKGDGRIPVRNPGVRGPLAVYYYDHLAAVLGEDADTAVGLARGGFPDVLAYEALNLVNGERSVAEIRDLLTGRYEPVREADVASYLELLARAGVVTFKGKRPTS